MSPSSSTSESSDTPDLGGLGEFGLIARVTRDRPPSASTLLGPGDDAAVVAQPDGRVVACVDVLVEGVHFRLDWSRPEDVGRKVVAANLADVAAMGAAPTGLLVGLVAPADTPVATLEGLADGMWAEAQVVGVGLVGGDVAAGPALMISVTALGTLEGREAVLRSGARPGDQVAVCGRLGWAAAGLAVLTRGFRSPGTVVGAHRAPEPPYAAGPAAALAGATAMIDVSDGLLADLGHVAEASGVGISLERKAFEVPERLVEVGAALGVDPMEWVLTGGEDHALAATFPAGAALPEGFTPIGLVVEGSGVTVDGEEYAGGGGWEHFTPSQHSGGTLAP
ncbi:thiamine-phosphate kinase [Pseudonocardia xishanensis]|uniref:Thiamine-monophosphate kinase n=1 Tax=Pseudonocardia xishanensis TaxID=630995 RepID=A0ABP8S373_9PSEU